MNYILSLLVGVAGLIGAAKVVALSDSTNIGDSWKGWNLNNPDATEQGIETDAAWLYPSLSAKLRIDDNYYNTGDNGVTATTVRVTPRLQAEFEGDTTLLRATAEIFYEYNFQDQNDSSLGASLVAELGWDPAEKLNLWGGLGWELGHEPRGSGLGEGAGAPVTGFGTALAGGNVGNLFSELLEWHEWSVRIGGDYGSDDEGAPKLNFEAAHKEKTYQNFTEISSSRDRVLDQIGGSILYWLQPNTAVNFSARYFKYAYGDGGFDSTQWRVLLGIQWDATSQTQGYGQIGWGRKDLLDPELTDGAALNWEVGIRWKPTPIANFVVSASRDFVEEDFAGYGDMLEFRVAWKHQWESYLSSSLIFNFGTEEYPEYIGELRDDDFWDLEFQLNYKARPWLTFDASLRHSERESNLDQSRLNDNLGSFGYKENVFILGVDVTFY